MRLIILLLISSISFSSVGQSVKDRIIANNVLYYDSLSFNRILVTLHVADAIPDWKSAAEMESEAFDTLMIKDKMGEFQGSLVHNEFSGKEFYDLINPTVLALFENELGSVPIVPFESYRDYGDNYFVLRTEINKMDIPNNRLMEEDEEDLKESVRVYVTLFEKQAGKEELKKIFDIYSGSSYAVVPKSTPGAVRVLQKATLVDLEKEMEKFRNKIPKKIAKKLSK